MSRIVDCRHTHMTQFLNESRIDCDSIPKAITHSQQPIVDSSPKPAPQSKSESAEPNRIHELVAAWNGLFMDDEGHVDRIAWKRLEDAFAALCVTLCGPNEYSALRQIVESWDACDATVNIPPFDGSRALFEAVGVARMIVNSTPAPAPQSESEAVRLLRALFDATQSPTLQIATMLNREASALYALTCKVEEFLKRPPSPDWRTLHAAARDYLDAEDDVSELAIDSTSDLHTKLDVAHARLLSVLNSSEPGPDWRTLVFEFVERLDELYGYDTLVSLNREPKLIALRDALASEVAAAGEVKS